MNIFYLSSCPVDAASFHCDKHVVKMILEYAQLLSTAHHVLDGDDAPEGIYKCTHKNHPSAVWARQSSSHYAWLYDLFVECLDEYKRRYVREHATSRLKDTLLRLPKNIPLGGFTQPPQCMPDEYKCDNAVEAYRNYYKGEKAGFAAWTNTKTPPWWYTEAEDYARVY